MGSCQTNIINSTTLIDGAIVDTTTSNPFPQGCCHKDYFGYDVKWSYSDLINDFTCFRDLCANVVDVVTLLDGTVVFGNNELVSETCCNSDVVGQNVYWDGVNGKCRIVASNPCDNVDISEFNGEFYNITTSECCTKSITGVDVYWNGKQCIKSPSCGDINSYTVGPAPIYEIFGDGQPISQICCTKETTGYDVVWGTYGNTDLSEIGVPKKICRQIQEITTPIIEIGLNETPIETSECDDLFVSMWMYFTSPNGICNNGIIETPTGECNKEGCSSPVTECNEKIGCPPPVTECNEKEPCVPPRSVNGCCYDRLQPIIGKIKTNNPNIGVETIAIYDSEYDGFDVWAGLTVKLTNTFGNPFNLLLELTGGITSCCDYDIHIDDIRVDCFKNEDRLFWKNTSCPGFDIRRVIDNKKSWVYNPGLEMIGTGEEDKIIRDNGDYSLLKPHATINREFAPSPDADLPWRYTDYFVQSGIKEKHSKLVLNSKEVFLTFNMCTPKDCSISGKTVTLLQLEDYKKVFQSFWVQMIEQFVPATTIFVAGEKWCNAPDIICSEFDECDYDFEYVDSEVTSIVFETDGSDIPRPKINGFVSDLPTVEDGVFTTERIHGGDFGVTINEPLYMDSITILPVEKEKGFVVEVFKTEPNNNSNLIRERNRYLSKLSPIRSEIIFE